MATKVPNIYVGILLKRKPMLTKELTEFELNYLQYRDFQKQDDAKPFRHEFYFKKGTLAEKRWLEAQEQNPGMVVQPAETEFIDWKPTTIETEDTKSLDRKLRDNLYLFVKTSNGWELPSGPIFDNELLHEAAPKRLHEIGGDKMNTWFVGGVPCGMHKDGKATVYQTNETFFMKAHILGGNVNTKEHQWLTKEELKTVNEKYFESIKDML
jgi:large subunit ribosomal protein L46